ncbi:MAG: serine hydrolase, partial [Gemmatimonadetes bacterium]|nr:serine hydrolase [Gemmatimonadota bacterium]
MPCPTRIATLLATALALTAPPPAARAQPAPGPSARVDALVERYRVARQVPGIAVAVVRNGTVIKARGYGVASLELGTPVSPR